MPYVNVKITREGAMAEQEAALIRGVTRLSVDFLDKNPRATVVTINEIEIDNWERMASVPQSTDSGRNHILPEDQFERPGHPRFAWPSMGFFQLIDGGLQW